MVACFNKILGPNELILVNKMSVEILVYESANMLEPDCDILIEES